MTEKDTFCGLWKATRLIKSLRRLSLLHRFQEIQKTYLSGCRERVWCGGNCAYAACGSIGAGRDEEGLFVKMLVL